MSYTDYRMGPQLLGVETCPHCGIANPTLNRTWQSDGQLNRADGREKSRWSAYACTTCGSLVSAKGEDGLNTQNPIVTAIFPDLWAAHSSIPDRARSYLTQARNTLRNPDASVVMSASALDARLKDKGLAEGSLYARVNLAVEQQILTKGMADWAHKIRLDANNPRHADQESPHMTEEDAQRSFDFAKAIAEILYVLPSRMPATEQDDNTG